MTKHDNSLAALESFRTESDGSIASYSYFPANIIYKYGQDLKTVIRERTTVSLVFDRTQFNHGNIEIIESGDLNAEDHYLGFSPKYQQYSAMGTTLKVSGAGEKIGLYEVTITPII